MSRPALYYIVEVLNHVRQIIDVTERYSYILDTRRTLLCVSQCIEVLQLYRKERDLVLVLLPRPRRGLRGIVFTGLFFEGTVISQKLSHRKMFNVFFIDTS